MRLLFIKTTLGWPRASGHDVYTYYTMKACAALGHQVYLATASELQPEAIEGLDLAGRFQLDASDLPAKQVAGTWLQRKFRSYWGVREAALAGLDAAVAASRAEAVIVVGLDGLPYFPPLRNVVRVWFPADEWVWHHLSQVRLADPATWWHLKSAAVKGLYERVHARVIDRVWVVSEPDQRAMRWIGGMRHVDVVPLGVDSNYFRPASTSADARTAVFWGRLDFGPNVQALEWFAEKVWPLVRREAGDARLTIMGFNPGPGVRRLGSLGGISIEANVPDLREVAHRHAIVVLPLVSGGGMKNKLLEAAAMGFPIVCTPLATQGLQALSHAPLEVASGAEAFARAMLRLWADDRERCRTAQATREWVVQHHDWLVTGRRAMATIEARGAREPK